MGKPQPAAEPPENALRHCLTEAPYRMVVFVGFGPHGTPLFQVAGSGDSPCRADNALRKAHALHGGRCFYCKQDVPDGALTLEHAVPKATGGRNDIQNLLIACRPCNQSKGADPIELYNPKAGHEWLSAVLRQVRDRMNRLPPG